jgi:hypothetical protein
MDSKTTIKTEVETDEGKFKLNYDFNIFRYLFCISEFEVEMIIKTELASDDGEF